jgi:hypothetical protein
MNDIELVVGGMAAADVSAKALRGWATFPAWSA